MGTLPDDPQDPTAPDTSGARLPLRPYQEQALASILEALQRGARRLLVVAPMGSGKTLIAARLPERLTDPRLLYICHREELLQQTLRTFLRERPDRSAGIERAEDQADPSALTVVSTIQSLSRPSRLARYRPEDWPVLVCDEAHRSTAASYLAVFRHFGHIPGPATPERTDGLLLGLTGTSRRTDNVGLTAVYQEIAYTITLRELVERGYLAPLRGYLVRSSTRLEHIRIVETADGERDYDARELARVLNTRPRNELVVDATRQLALSSTPPRPTIVFACDIAHTEALAHAFQRAGIAAEAVHSQIDRGRRLAILEAFRRGHIQVLVNCEILVEGVDLPMASAIVMARPTRSTILYSQAVGRGMRLSPETGKTDCLIIDLVDASPEHAAGLVTLPTLFGLPPRMDLAGQAAHTVLRQLETAASALETGIDDDTLQRITSPEDIPRIFREFDFWKIAGLPPHVSALTRFAWQRLPSGAYMLFIPKPRAPVTDSRGALVLASRAQENGAIQLIIEENALGHAEVRSRAGSSDLIKLREFPSLTTAFQYADSLIEQRYRDRLPLLAKDAPWRQRPASPRQLQLLAQLGTRVGPGISAGQASLLISLARALRLERAAQLNMPATPGQLRYLRFLGITPSGPLTKRQAGRLISEAKKQRAAARAQRAPRRQPAPTPPS